MSLSFESGSYGLRQVDSGNKTVLLMKLTDSALRIIESYLDNPGSLRSKPSIQFQGNQGSIQIPVPGDGELQQFSFHVSHQPPVDCLQQIRTSHSEKVEYLGTVQKKITINANDDSYDVTRQRMKQAKQDEQNTSTKVIKQPGSKLGKMYKKTPKGRLMEKSHLPSKSKLSPDGRAPTPPMSRLNPALNRSSSPLTLPGKDRSISPVAGMGRNKTKPNMTFPSSAKGGSSPGYSGNTAVAAKPLPQRVAHLLALRPYKLPEIMLRLQRDKPADKSRVLEALQKVATSRNTAGVGLEHCLMKSQYPKLEPDAWPGYTESERKTVTKKIAEIAGNNEIRKRPHSNAQSPPEIPTEPPHADEDYTNPTVKKARVSHLVKRSPPPEPEKTSRGPGRSPAGAGISFGTATFGQKDRGRRKPSASPEAAKVRASPLYEVKAPSPFSMSSDDFVPSNDDESVSSLDEDYLRKYTQISSDEQRDRYKNDFYAEYGEYLSHHNSVCEVAKKFETLQSKLHKYEKGSEGYLKVSKQVVQEYQKTKKDIAYHQEKARWLFLHRKLQHIKELVNAFDQHKLSRNRPQNQSQFSMQPATKVA